MNQINLFIKIFLHNERKLIAEDNLKEIEEKNLSRKEIKLNNLKHSVKMMLLSRIKSLIVIIRRYCH